MSSQADQRFETAMGRMLQIGVTVAALVVLLGGVLYLKQCSGPLPDYRRFHGAPGGHGTIHGILVGVSSFDSQSLIELGILCLIATPICRVIFNVVGFSLRRDCLYTTVSVIVLIILMLSFFMRR